MKYNVPNKLSALRFFILVFMMVSCSQGNKDLIASKLSYLINKAISMNSPAEFKESTEIPNSQKVDRFKMRKYFHVAELYTDLAPAVIELCKESKVPPAAILAIVSLESGWGTGYISQITGNILSLNATHGRAELPALYLPVVKQSGRVLFDEKEIASYNADELDYQDRPASLKRDYRPAGIAGTTGNLSYFKYHHDEKVEAEVKCINDFITRFISHRSSIAAYREARRNLDRHVAERGVDVLFDYDVNIEFVNTIGGRPNSFNFRKEWPRKVEVIIKGAGLIELVSDMGVHNKPFSETW